MRAQGVGDVRGGWHLLPPSKRGGWGGGAMPWVSDLPQEVRGPRGGGRIRCACSALEHPRARPSLGHSGELQLGVAVDWTRPCRTLGVCSTPCGLSQPLPEESWWESRFSGWVAQAVPGPAVWPLVHAWPPRPWGVFPDPEGSPTSPTLLPSGPMEAPSGPLSRKNTE